MTEKQIEKYIKSLGKIKNLNIDSDALSSAIGDMIKSVDDGTFHEKYHHQHFYSVGQIYYRNINK